MKHVQVEDFRRVVRRVFVAVFVWSGAVTFAAAASSAASPPAAANTAPLTPPEARERIEELRREIARHDALYHRKAAPEISDSDYDQLKRRLRELEAAFPEAARDATPLAEIGDDRTGLFQIHRHRERMLSLDKAYAEPELHAFHARLARRLGREDLAYVIEPKFDGIAVSVTYEKGNLVRAVTRGNGTEGDDITANIRQIPGLPRTLRAMAADGGNNAIPDVIEVRGEIYVGLADFARLNAERELAGEPPFANPRNLAAGTIRQLDPREIAGRGLQVVFYGMGACEPAAALPATQRELHERFKAWGLPGIAKIWAAQGRDELTRAVEAVRLARPGFEFPTDGAVVKLDSLALQREAGAAENAPRWAVAYKFAPERVVTQLLAITVQVGRTGVLTPVAELTPVSLAGSTIARATLHNREEIARRDIRVGDFVFLEKAGEIIPAVVGVDVARRPATARPYEFPVVCPGCRAPVAERPGEVAVRCANTACPAQLRRRIEHFASKACVDIAGLGPAMMGALVERRLVNGVPDLYRLRRQDMLALGRNGEKSAGQLLAGIEASKRAELWRLIYGLGIPQVGAVTARDLARRFGSLEALVAQRELAGTQSREGSESGNDPVLRAVATHFAEARNRAVVDELLAAGVRPTGPAGVGGKSALTGKTFVLTGTLPTLTRAQAAEKIVAAGGKVAGSVSRATHYVVVGAEPGSKLDQAKTLGVAVIDEAELLRFLGEQ